MAQIKMGRWVTQSGQSESSSLELGTDTLVGVYTPSTLDAAQLKVQVSSDGAAFVDVMDGGSPLILPADVNAYLPLDPVKLVGAWHVRLAHLDGAGAAVVETAQRELAPVFRSFE